MAFLKNNDVGYEEIKIPVPWGHVAGKWWGPRDLQPILAIHGSLDNAGSFDSLAIELQKQNIPIFCIDLPGHGFSSHYQTGVFYNLIWDGVFIIHRIFKHYGWMSKLTLMGHAIGAAIAFHYSAIFCDEVAKIIALDCLTPVPENISHILQDFSTCVDKFLELEATDNQNVSYDYKDVKYMIMESHHNTLTPAALTALMNRSVKPSDVNEDRYEFCRDPRLDYAQNTLMTRKDILHLSSKLTCKILLIRANTGITFDDFTDELLQHFKDNETYVQVQVVHGNHYVHLNNPTTIIDYILNFLNH